MKVKRIWGDARILVVDDMEANVNLLARVLRREGYQEIHTATDGETGLELADTIAPDLILLDLHMPRMNGVEVLASLSARVPEDVYLPVIVLTADTNAESKQLALELGAMDFVTKPFDSTEVLLRVRNLLHTRALHVEMDSRVRDRTRALNESHIEALERLARAGEFRDDVTGRHAERVGELAARLARAIGQPERTVELIRKAAPLHDVGKIGISDEILLKPGRLSEEEWPLMKSHTIVGARILGNGRADLIRMAEGIALSHHERWDGEGYPDHLAGQAIPLGARIVAVADVYDALCHDRPYRRAWQHERVIEQIAVESGKHFDPAVVDAFLSLMSGDDGDSLLVQN